MSGNLLACIYVFVGGGTGAVMRYLLGIQAAKLWGVNFPYGTLIINILGSFLIGVIASYFALYSTESNQSLRLFLIVGILGGFTTFSSFSLETLMLLQRGEFWLAIGYILLSVLISLAVAHFGFELAKMKFN
jgi:CrcB protein